MSKQTLGTFRLISLDDGPFRLDGGAMYGVVPRALWSRESPPDDLNRIPMRARPLLVQGPSGSVLIESGLGDAGDATFRDRFRVEQPRGLGPALAAAGVASEEIRGVVMSHLHWDHAGGLVHRGPAGDLRPTFPNAVHFVQEETWQAAFRPGPRAASYHPERLEPLARHARVELVRGETEVVPGLTLRPAGGHCEGHSVVLIRSAGKTAVFLGDLVPLRSQFRPLWVMAYDLWPARTVEAKEQLFAEALAGGWLQVLYHDPDHAFGTLGRDDRERLVFEPL